MKIYNYHVEIKDGQIAFKSQEHQNMFHRFLEQFNGKQVTLEVLEKKSKRSDEQNKYYWLYLGIISDETGHTVDELHNYFKGKFLTKEIKEILGEKTRITKSTTTLSKGQFCEYLLDISTVTQVELPDTEAYFGYSYHK